VSTRIVRAAGSEVDASGLVGGELDGSPIDGPGVVVPDTPEQPATVTTMKSHPSREAARRMDPSFVAFDRHPHRAIEASKSFNQCPAQQRTSDASELAERGPEAFPD
jgi:hypothetical protein